MITLKVGRRQALHVANSSTTRSHAARSSKQFVILSPDLKLLKGSDSSVAALRGVRFCVSPIGRDTSLCETVA